MYLFLSLLDANFSLITWSCNVIVGFELTEMRECIDDDVVIQVFVVANFRRKREMQFHIILFIARLSQISAHVMKFSIFISITTKVNELIKVNFALTPFQISQYSKRCALCVSKVNSAKWISISMLLNVDKLIIRGKVFRRTFAENDFVKCFNGKFAIAPTICARHIPQSEIQRHWESSMLLHRHTFYLLFDEKPLRDERRKHILYDDCLFWFRLWLIVELFHLHLFFLSTRVETTNAQASDAFYWNQWVILDVVVVVVAIPLAFGILPCSRDSTNEMNVYKSFWTNEKRNNVHLTWWTQKKPYFVCLFHLLQHCIERERTVKRNGHAFMLFDTGFTLSPSPSYSSVCFLHCLQPPSCAFYAEMLLHRYR